MTNGYTTKEDVKRIVSIQDKALTIGFVFISALFAYKLYDLSDKYNNLHEENEKLRSSVSNLVQRVDYYRGTNAPYSTNLVDSAEGVRK